MVLVRKSEGKRQFRRSIRKWGDNIKTDLTEIRWRGLDWINVAHGRDGGQGGWVL